MENKGMNPTIRTVREILGLLKKENMELIPAGYLFKIAENRYSLTTIEAVFIFLKELGVVTVYEVAGRVYAKL